MNSFMTYFLIYMIIAFILELYVFWDYITGREQMTKNEVIWYQKRIWTWPVCLFIYILYCIYAIIVDMKLK